MKDTININLTKEEAIVLFEFLSRFNQVENNNIFEDQAEQRILFDVESILESQLSETFLSNYAEKISEARKKIRDRE